MTAPPGLAPSAKTELMMSTGCITATIGCQPPWTLANSRNAA